MISDNLRTIRALDPGIRKYLAAYFAFMFVFAGMRGVLLNLYMLRLGYGVETIGLLNGVMWGTFALLALPSGYLTTRIDMRRMIVTGTILFFAAHVALISNELFGRHVGLYVLYGFGLLMGTGGALFYVTGFPFLMACAREHKESVFSYRFIASLAGGFLGAVFAGFLPALFASLPGVSVEGPASYRYSLAVATVIVAIPIVISARIAAKPAGTPAGRPSEPSAGEAAERAAGPASSDTGFASHTPVVWIVGVVGVVTLLTTMGNSAQHSFYNLLLERVFTVPVTTIGIVIGLAQVIKLPGALLAPALTKRYGPYRLMIAAGLLRSALVAAIALAPHWILTAVALLGCAVAESAAAGAPELFNQSVVKPGHRPIMAGVYTTAFGVGGATSLAGGGFIAAAVGFSPLYLIAAAALLAAAGVLWLGFRRSVSQLLPEYNRAPASSRMRRAWGP